LNLATKMGGEGSKLEREEGSPQNVAKEDPAEVSYLAMCLAMASHSIVVAKMYLR